MATYRPKPAVYVPPAPTLPPYIGYGTSSGSVFQSGGFTAVEYAKWATLSGRAMDVATAQAVLDQAVIDGYLTLS